MAAAFCCQARRAAGSSGTVPEGGDRPGEAAGGGVLADAALTVVHDGGELGEEPAAFGIIGFGNLGGPCGGRERDEIAVAAADAGVDHGGGVADAGQVPFGDCPGEDLARVQAGELGGAQGAVQPLLLVAGLMPGSRRERGLEQGTVAPLASGRGLRGPYSVQDGQVVGVGQGLLPGLGRGLAGSVPFGDDLGEHAPPRWSSRGRPGRPGRDRLPAAVRRS